MSRALRLSGSGHLEISDSETLNVGRIAPLTGDLTVGGSSGSGNVVVAAGQAVTISGSSGALNLTSGADLTSGSGGTLSGFDSIEGIASGNLLDKSATEVITGQWIINSGSGINPKLIVRAAGGEAGSDILLQVQTSGSSGLLSVNADGDVIVAGDTGCSGDINLTGNLYLRSGGLVSTTANGDLELTTSGSGVINATSNLNATAGLDVTGGTLTTGSDGIDSGGDVDVTGDLTVTRDVVLRGGTGAITTTVDGDLTLETSGSGVINATSNLNATAGLDVTGGTLTTGSDGIDSGGRIDLIGTLSFDTAGTISIDDDSTLSITTGSSGSITTTAALVDLQTNTTALDVPEGIGFMIGGSALTTANWNSTNVDTLLDGGNATALHVHNAINSDQVRSLTITTGSVAQYQAAYIRLDRTALPTTAGSDGTLATAMFAGVYDGTAGTLVTGGEVVVQFDGSLGCVAGEPAVLSGDNPGQFTNIETGTGINSWVTRVGVILDASTYASNQRCTILIHAQWPEKISV